MKERKRKSFSAELTKYVMRVVVFSFFSAFIIIIFTTYRNSRNHEIENQRYQLEKTAVQIKTLQDTVENIEKQVLSDDAVQNVIHREEESTGQYLYIKRKAQNRLSSYAHIMDVIEEIMIFTEDGRTFTNRSIRDPFRPEKYLWYGEVIANPDRQYSVIHDSEATQDGTVIPVVSHISSYVQTDKEKTLRGNLLLNIKLDALKKIATPDSAMLKGYVLFDSQGNVILQQNNTELTYGQVLQFGNREGDQPTVTLSGGDVCLVTENLKGGWCLASVVSGDELMQQVWKICLYPGAMFILTSLFLSVLLRVLLSRVITPVNELSRAAQRVGQGDFFAQVDTTSDDEVGMLISVFNHMVVSIRSLMQRSVEHEKQARRMQIENLMLQINPHFIYNTLNSIVYMARMGECKKIVLFTNSFISLLQSTLTIRDSIYSTVRNELKTVESYLILQKYRYDDKFSYVIRCKEAFMECTVLNVMLQPIVENAIFHGIAPKEGSGLLQISVEREENDLKICVEDDGIGMDQKTIEMQLNQSDLHQKDGIRKLGIANVRERIQEEYGTKYGLTIFSKLGAGTRVIITVPYILNREDINGGEHND